MSELGLEVCVGFNHQWTKGVPGRGKGRAACKKKGMRKGMRYKGCSGTWRGLAQCDWRLQCVGDGRGGWKGRQGPDWLWVPGYGVGFQSLGSGSHGRFLSWGETLSDLLGWP